MKTQKSRLAKADKAAEAERQTISPPDGWALQSPFGYMRYDATPAGLLVRVAEVLRWLEKAHSLPRVAALKAMCEAMPPDVVNSLFWLRHNDYAKAVPGSFMWGFATAAQIEAKRKADTENRIFRDLKRKRDYPNADIVFVTPKIKPTPCATEPGLPALLKILGKYWKQSRRTRLSTCDILDDPTTTNLVNLAIRLDKAAALWGYGCSKTDQAIDAVAGPVEWTGQMLLAQQTALKLSGVKAYTETLSEMSGLAVREVTRRIKASRDPKPATVWNVTSLVNGKKSKKTSKA